jgi:hypothetical protein
MPETTLSEFLERKKAVALAKDALIAREAELKQELADIREAIGRKPRTPKAPKKLGVERKEQK